MRYISIETRYVVVYIVLLKKKKSKLIKYEKRDECTESSDYKSTSTKFNPQNNINTKFNYSIKFTTFLIIVWKP